MSSDSFIAGALREPFFTDAQRLSLLTEVHPRFAKLRFQLIPPDLLEERWEVRDTTNAGNITRGASAIQATDRMLALVGQLGEGR